MGKKSKKKDMVNHPSHYKTSSGLEAIDVIEAFTEGLQGKYATNKANALKYILRWPEKVDSTEDLEKSKWYIDRLIMHSKKRLNKKRKKKCRKKKK